MAATGGWSGEHQEQNRCWGASWSMFPAHMDQDPAPMQAIWKEHP